MITYGHHVANETPDSVFRLVPSNMKTEGFLPDSYRTVVNGLNPFHSPTTSAGDSLWNYAGELRMAEGFRPSRELARRQECTFVIMRQQSHTTRQHSYGTGGFCHDINYLPLEIPTLPQRACRVQIAIHLTRCVFETHRSESRPASAWYSQWQTESFSIHIRPIHPCEGDGCSLFPAADDFNPEWFAPIYVSLPTNDTKRPLFTLRDSYVPYSPRVYAKNPWVAMVLVKGRN